ncbi:MAG: potassium transporter TrkA [Flammeovirgaceae bacterium]|nr:potassium transporter TrkA [Flammeovirgaceae bacterium]
MKKVTFSAKARYKFDNFVSKGTGQMIYGLGLFSVAFILFCSTLLLFVGFRPEGSDGMNLPESIWLNLTHVLDPGTVGGNEGGWPFLIFMMTVTLTGLIIITILIGLISNGIMDKIETLRKGRSFVIEQNHVVILGWSSKIFTIISELIIANANRKDAAIVILADKDKVAMEDEIRDKVKSFDTTRIICRTGNPIDLDDLQITNPTESKSIIILDKDNASSDSQIIKTIVAITTHSFKRAKPYHITAEIKDRKNLEVAKMVGKNEVELILSDEIISRIMVQTSRQSGLSVVYVELMDFDGDEIYFAEAPSLIGKTYRELLFAYHDSAIIGIHLANNSVVLNPPMDSVFALGDKVIGITEDDDTLIPDEKKAIDIQDDNILYTEKEPAHPEDILILGWNFRGTLIISELDNYVSPGSNVKVVSKFEESKLEIEQLQTELKNITLTTELMDTTDRASLEQLDLATFNYVILLSYKSHYPIQEADAQTLITLLHLRNFSERNETNFKIVSEMLDMKNRILANITSADDFVVSDNLVSLLMSQVSENKFLMRVFEELFNSSGSEIYTRDAAEYVQIDTPVNFYTILESAARRNETAIGYRNMKYAKDIKKGYGVVVNPAKSASLIMNPGDTIIVISQR